MTSTTSSLPQSSHHLIGGCGVHHSRGSLEPSPALSRTPTAASLATTDLRAELEHRRLREDGRTTIECRCEGHHNLEGDYDTTNTAPMGHATRSPSSPGTGGECAVLAPHLQMVVWPPKFWPHLLEKYDGPINPAEFLQIYASSILATGGNEVIMTNYFPVALTGTVRSWLINLPPWSLYSWEELYH
jgi:hypothetical protein